MIVIDREKLSDLHSVIRNFVSDTTEIAVNFDKEKGATIHTTDGSNACMSDIELMPEWFKKYEPKVNTIGLSYLALNNIISFSGKGTDISFETFNDGKQIKSILSNGEAKFELKINTIAPQNMRAVKILPAEKIANIKSKCNSYNVPVKEFKNILGYIKSYVTADNVSQSVSITVTESNELIVKVGDDATEVGSMVTKLEVFSIEKPLKFAYSMYGIMFLQSLKSELDIVDKNEMYVQLYIGNNYPMIAEIPAHDNTCFVTFILAPRIEETND